uniref:Acyl carrier protein n=1 Tax=Leiomenia cribrosa TaxID=217483 RepID=A0A4D6X0Z4_9FLOR|nr:Acyl carrier protein [Leiomenia cribrosa]
MSETIDILMEVKNIVAEKLGVNISKITPQAKFADDLGADSLDTIELVMAMEERFGIAINDQDAENIENLEDAVEFIELAIKNK